MLLALAVVLLLAGVAAVVSRPFLRPAEVAESRSADDDLVELEARKQSKYREIRDAEMDFRSGKLSEEDYRRLDDDLRREAIEILRRIDDTERSAGHH